MAKEQSAPVIIKRRRQAAQEAHHGGAWKVAYADFVTAMMAFFLLMWLLNATTEKQRKGLADYFSPTVPVSGVSGGGDGALWGDTVFSEDIMTENGLPATWSQPGQQGQSGTTSDGKGIAEAEDLLEELKARGGESMAALLEQRHVITRLTDEGLVIDIFSLPGQPLFMTNETPAPVLVATLGMVYEVLDLVRNGVAVNAHLPVRPLVAADRKKWQLSAERAVKARGTLEAAGFDPGRFRRVGGFADTKPVVDDPLALRNDRVEVVVLRKGL